MNRKPIFIAIYIALLSFALTAKAQTPPPAPSLVEPAAGAALVQPIMLRWNPVVAPGGPVGSYSWQVGTTSTFGVIVAAGATNISGDGIPAPTRDSVSGLPTGTYFWRVKATQIVGGVTGSIESAWSTVRSFTINGLGPAPGTPTFTSPANGARFHVREFFQITWTRLVDAHHYLLEADDEPTFSHPLTLTTDVMQFGTTFRAGWGNEIPNIYYRVVAVSANNVRGLPSPTLNVHITNAAPVPPPPTPLSPTGGATVSIPFTFKWTDTPNPQIPGYDLDIDDDPNFAGTIGVFFIQNISRSDYMLADNLPPGTYFWRVRAQHGDVLGPWSSGASFTVVAPPPTPPGLELFSIIAEPSSVSGGNPTQARVTLNMPAPPEGAVVKIASDLPHAQTQTSVTIPAGKTDATVSPITTVPVPGATIGTIRAAYAGGAQQSSLGLWPILWGLSLNAESVVGGTTAVGTVTLLSPAPAGGVKVTLVSSDTDLVVLPASVLIPAGATGATFDVVTRPVSIATRVVIDSGTGFEGYRAPSNWLTLVPPGSPAPAPSLASLTLASSRILGGGGTTGTVTLTAPAPAGGVAVWACGSMEGELVTPPCFPASVTIPAGSISADFPITAPQVNAPRFVLIQATYGTSGGNHAKLLEIDPSPPGPPTVLALDVRPSQVIGGNSTRGTVELVMVAPPVGGVVTLSSDDPTLVQTPLSVTIAPGNSANSFTVNTNPVVLPTGTRINATAGGVTKSFFINVVPDPNAALALTSLTLGAGSVAGGNSVSGTVFLNGNAPAGGTSVTLATSNASAAQPPAIVNVPAGQGFANFTVSTFSVSTNTAVTITGFLGNSSQSATFTVRPEAPAAPGTPSLLSPANAAQPVQPITLAWTSVANAASYEIQVDDSSTFTAPLVRSLTSTGTQTTVSGLATVRHWWRVRARSSAGVAGNWSASRSFTPQAAPAVVSLSGVSVSPPSVVGGNSSQGRVTLTAAAPTGGAIVTLTSNNTTVASVPANVTVPAGASSTNFAIGTTGVTAATAVTIGGTFAGATRTAMLTVNPQPPPPPQSATLTVTATGRNGERVNSSPAGINVTVGTTGSATFAGGTSITLSVSNGRDAIWSGACSSGGRKVRTCTFTLAGNASVTANVQ